MIVGIVLVGRHYSGKMWAFKRGQEPLEVLSCHWNGCVGLTWATSSWESELGHESKVEAGSLTYGARIAVLDLAEPTSPECFAPITEDGTRIPAP